ncbi:MAG: hypothetical protein KDJ38_05395, partial [Gammaproteobacteria bacterium]|nr:hypothetical protein [Gammaproteobacteria bacterium]
MKIAFLYFDDIHHIYHSVSIAIELSRMLGKSHQIVLLSSTADNTRLLEKFCAGHQNHYCEVRQLKATLGYRLFYRFHRKFPRKSRMLKKHRKLLAGFDAIVGTELSSAKLRRYLGDKTPSLILTKHGAGDRSYGYRTDIKHYDFI